MGYFNPIQYTYAKASVHEVSSIQHPVSDKTFTFATCYYSKRIYNEK